MLRWMGIVAMVICASSCSPAGGGGGKSGTGTRSEVGRIRIVCTVGMVTDMVRQIAGDRAEVSGIIGTGVDPHLYQPTRDDVARLEGADMVFYSGLLLEGRMTDVLEKIGKRKPVVAVTERLDESYLLQPPGFGGHHDPHVWMDVSAWAQGAEVIAKALQKQIPDGAAEIEERGKQFAAECMKLHEYGKTVIGSIPEARRVLITSHDAFNYFGRAYGLEVRGVQGISTESEAGLADINALVRFIVEREVQAVFVESSVPKKNIEALIEGAKARGHTVSVGGELFSDAMGAEGTYEGTYLGMLDHNLTLVARALGGEAPEHGWQGKLAAFR